MTDKDSTDTGKEQTADKDLSMMGLVLYGLGNAIVAGGAGILFWILIPDLKPPRFFETIDHRTVFVVAILISVWAQTTVDKFFKSSRQFSTVKLPGKGLIEGYSSTVMTALVIASVAFISHFQLHIVFTLAYLGVVLGLDFHVWHGARNQSKLLVRMCGELMSKIDGLAFVGLSLLCLFGLIIAQNSSLGPGAGPDKSAFVEIFLSGAIGFHLIATAWLISICLRDWQKQLVEEAARTASASNSSSG